MILLFPNLDTLRLALAGSIVPPEVTLAPARVSFDDRGKIYLESDASLTRAVIRNLDRIGVKGSKRHASDAPEDLSCWPQALPVVREAEPPNVSGQAPVLFELSDADDLPTLATEMLRLGNDRQGFRWFAAPGDDEARRVLLRVVGPPYYTLLRALDRDAAGTKGTVRAYLERAPRLWVEVGFNHPVAPQIRVAERQLLLVRAPREWVYLDEAPFQDVYEIVQFQLPSGPVEWAEAKAPKKMSVPLRLTAGNAADVPELWVLRENAVEQLDALVRDSDDRLTQRLMFAVATDPRGTPAVVLRTRPSKLAPPHLALENARAYKPYWKLPNLFVPVGRRLHPTLRRDAVRRLLADDPDQVVWLAPDGKAGFTPESVPDGAFRPLEDWVDYVIEAERQPLAAWIEATRFDFDHFVCKDPGGPKPRPDRGDKEPRERDEEDRPGRGAVPQPRTAARGKASAKSPPTEFLAPPEEVKKPSEWKLRRAELEKQFQEVEGGLDAPERQALWPQLAVASAGIPEESEAAVCWLNAMWNSDPIPAEWLGAWVRGELGGAGGPVRAEDFDRALALPSVGQKEARSLVAMFLWLAAQKPVPSWLNSRLPAVQAYLEKHEAALPVRAVWLGGYRLAQLSGSDVLGLARVRDRVLNRLLTEGLSPEKDLPSFLRYAGHKDSERMRVVREKALDLHAAVRAWSQPHPQNLPYIDLLFAFAMARLQETSTAKKFVEDARRVLEVPVPTTWSQNKDFEAFVRALTSNWFFKAFRHRIDQVLAGETRPLPMAPDLLSEVEEISNKGRTAGTNNPYFRAEYLINRLRYTSKILEPQGTLHPYAVVTRQTDPLQQTLTQLHALRDINKIVDQIQRLLKNGVPGKADHEAKFLVLREALIFAPRAGEAITLEWLKQVPAVVAAWGSKRDPGFSTSRLNEQGELLVRAIVPAGHYDRRDIVKQLIEEFSNLIHGKRDDERFKLINVVCGHSLRVMKKLGMRDEIDRFYTMLHSEILRGASTGELRKKYAAAPSAWSGVLQTSLNLAGGWLSFGMTERAEPILAEARNELLGPQAVKLDVTDYTKLASAYVTALGQGPSELAVSRLLELFQKMDQKRIPNTSTTAQCYSQFHLALVEDVIRAIVSDDFALGPGGRKWLDDDEYLVRRRVHADMNRERERSGL
jgi:hypothetical protein